MRLKYLLLLAAIAFAQLRAATAPAKPEGDPFDTSATRQKIEELGIPTPAKVHDLQMAAESLAAQQRWKEGADAYGQLAKVANWLSNVESAALKPYYTAGYDEKKEYPYSAMAPLIAIEKRVNDLRGLRDHAMVQEAKCYVNSGDKERALQLLVGSLSLIDIKNQTDWNQAQSLLFGIIEVK